MSGVVSLATLAVVLMFWVAFHHSGQHTATVKICVIFQNLIPNALVKVRPTSVKRCITLGCTSFFEFKTFGLSGYNFIHH